MAALISIFCSLQLNKRLCCETIDMELMHCSMILIAPTHGWMIRLRVDWVAVFILRWFAHLHLVSYSYEYFFFFSYACHLP